MHNHNLFIIPLQVALWKVSHIKDPNVPKLSKKNGWTKNHVEGLEPLWTMGDILPTNLADILEHQNVDESDDDELDLNDDAGWDSDNYDEESDCDVESDDEFDGSIHYWFKIVANAFERTQTLFITLLFISFHMKTPL